MNGETNVLHFFKPGNLPYALLILLITFVAARLVTQSLERLGRRFADKRLLINQAGSFVRFGIYLVGGFGAVATVLVLTQEVLLAVGGTVAVSIGFALKDLVASLVAGLIILVDKPFQVGDRVTFDGHYGEIRDIGLRSVRLLTLDDTLVTIPNNKFLTDVVASGNAGAVEMMIQMDFFIGLDQDVARGKRIVQEALTTSRYVYLKRPWAVLVGEVAQAEHFAIRLRAKAYVLDVRFEKAFETDVSEQVLARFRAEGILPPATLMRRL
jgi:small-conductance mechanosensitive channel